ncbi:CFC_HP_G0025110.mRNA.1.CDS.1 [Saccharomyces cerevisiae]|nr:CFC_HP_G0025110.mRNA.1.CDS.1 [Saccharomyces cerevisiae]CAI6944638.1 CFC_HP_G0025110.mRNA.1.CDS.1 [Saccharomyces cerevisiae]
MLHLGLYRALIDSIKPRYSTHPSPVLLPNIKSTNNIYISDTSLQSVDGFSALKRLTCSTSVTIRN